MGSKYLAALLALPAAAQTVSGRIAGTITDGSGAAVANAVVAIESADTGAKWSATSTANGAYTVYPLPPGAYALTVSAAGFRSTRIEALRLDAATALTRNITLEVSRVETSVSVTADSVPVLSQSASLESTILREQIDTLPLNGRDFNQLVTLAAGAVDNNVGGGTDFGAVAVNGNRSYSNDYLLDGTPNNNLFQNRSAAPVSVDLIREFKVTSGVAAAEYGQAGTQVNVVSRSGANRVHGSAFEYYRGNALQARDPFNTMEQQPFRRHQFGGSFGGPIRRNKAFFFANYEGNRQLENVTRLVTLPRPEFWAGDFTLLNARRIALNDPAANRAPFPANRIPASRIDRSALALRPFFGDPTSSGLANNALRFPEQTDNGDQFTGRVDYLLPANQSIAVRYTQSDTGGFLPNLLGSEGVGRTEPLDSRNATLTWTAPFRATIVNELRFGAMNFSDIITYSNGKLPTLEQLGWRGFEAADSGVPPLPPIQFTGTDAFTQLKYGGTATFGEAALSMINNVFTLADTLSIQRGAHQIKVGFEGRRVLLNSLQQTNARGQITFRGANAATSSGYSFADFLLGIPGSTQQIPVKPKVLFTQQEFATYIQDDWRVSRNLTLSLGLRHELFLNPFEERNRLAMFDDVTGAIVVAGPSGLPTSEFLPLVVSKLTDGRGNWRFPLVSASSVSADPRRILDTKYGNWGPRFGFVRALPSANMVIRGGYGIFYSRYPIQYLLQTVAINPPFAGLFTYNQAITNGQPLLRLDAPYPSTGGTASVSPAGLQRDFGLPDNQQWNLTIERSLGWSTVASLGYVGNKGSHLFRSVNANGTYLDASGQVQRRFAATYGTSAINVRRSDGNSIYNAMQLELRRRNRKGLIFQGNWTWAKGIDDVGGTVQAALLDVENLGRDRADSDYVRRHVVNVNATWEMPFGRGKSIGNAWPRALDWVAGGWRLAGIWRFTTGRYLTPTFTTTGGLSNNRPDVVAGASPNLPAPRRGADRWFNTAAFAEVPAVDPQSGRPRFGNAGRNTILGPGLNVADASLAKIVRLRESHAVTFRLELFNALNHPNFGPPDTNISNVNTVGTINRVIRPMRQTQFAVRYDF